MSVHVNTKHLTMHTDLMLEKRKKKLYVYTGVIIRSMMLFSLLICYIQIRS